MTEGPPLDPAPGRRSGWDWICAALIGLLAIPFFAHNLLAGKRFADESAYLTQTYYADLWLTGSWNDIHWISLPALDLTPLPKYLMGMALRLSGYPRALPHDARTWYTNTAYAWGTPGMLRAARWPSVILGAIGCMAIYGIGLLAAGRRVGVLAAILLALNPLYYLHARRAMADVPTEALVLSTLFCALWIWKHTLASGRNWRIALMTLLAGALAGLALASKLNGALALIVTAAWVLLAWVLPGVTIARKAMVAAWSLDIAALGLVTFTLLNPYLIAHPAPPVPANLQPLDAMSYPSRFQKMLTHRLEMSAGQKEMFRHNALSRLPDKLKVTLVQGFGRFGPLGPQQTNSTIRYDVRQDCGVLLWLPWVVAGAAWAARRGLAQHRAGQPPTAWGLLVQAVVAFLVVAIYIPMAWDRYMLPLQPGSALLAAGVVVAAFDAAAGALNSRRAANARAD